MKKLVTLVTLCMVCMVGSYSPASSAQLIVQTSFDVQNVLSGEPEPHPQTIYVKTRVNGTVQLIPLLVFFQDPVLWAKSQLADILDIPMDSFDLTFRGVVLDENLKLNDYRITTGSILSVVYY
jgi:hypothetical protein